MAEPTKTIECEKCKSGTMSATKIPRMSPGLRLIGYSLWVPALIILLLATGCGALMGGSSGQAAVEIADGAKRNAVARLTDIEGVPEALVREFEANASLSAASLDALGPDQRARVDAVISAHDSSLVGAGIGSAAATGIAGMGVFVAYVIGLPFFIIGLLLTRTKNVWRCAGCGYVFDRA